MNFEHNWINNLNIFKQNIHIIFILSNIFENINGVSNKYTKFIQFINNNFSHINISIILTRSKNNDNPFPIYKNTKYYLSKGIRVPFYKDIKVPIPSYKMINNLITTKKEVIILNGEFIWIYEHLIKLKKKYPQINILPNWHTDYEYYINNVYKIFKFSSSFINQLNFNLQNNNFSGIIVTGKKMVEKYKSFTKFIVNVNELDLSVFKNYKFDNYLNNHFNFIYTGRISKEKNIDFILNILPSIINKLNTNFNFHFIGDGPYLSEFKNKIFKEFDNYKSQIIFHGMLKPNKIFDLYYQLNNRFFIFPSTSETFGKSPLEAGVCGIPLFILKSDVSDDIYIHRKNAFIINNEEDFIKDFYYFLNLNKEKKEEFIHSTIDNSLLYDQNKIFSIWIKFIEDFNSDNYKIKLNLLDNLSFKSFNTMIQCSNNIIGEN